MRKTFALLSLAVLSVASLLSVSAAVADPVQSLALSPNMTGNKTLEVCNGRTISPTGIWTTFPCKQWEVNLFYGQIYPAYELYPAAAVYSGNVVNNCGSSSAIEVVIEATTPTLALLSVRLDVCDASTPPGSNPLQLYIEAECSLFVGDAIRMNGTIASTFYDNRLLNGHPVPGEKSHGDCRLVPKNSGAA